MTLEEYFATIAVSYADALVNEMKKHPCHDKNLSMLILRITIRMNEKWSVLACKHRPFLKNIYIVFRIRSL